MRRYPAFLNLDAKRCLVVGAGRVGVRKIAGLVDCGPKVLVVDTAPASTELKALLETGSLTFEHRAFTPRDVRGMSLVFAATSNCEVNRAVAQACREEGVPVNIADDPEESDFFVPASFDNHGITVAIGTGGVSPALSRRIRIDLQERLDKRYGHLLTLMERVRPMILELGLGSDENARVFRELVGSPLMDNLYENKPHKARKHLENILPPQLHSRIEELIHASL
jgi:precorrin-2 dehydrogenase/sirohydrochlorin ferrochelatase